MSDDDIRSPLEKHLDESGNLPLDPGRRVVQALRERKSTGASSAREKGNSGRSRSPPKGTTAYLAEIALDDTCIAQQITEYDNFVAFMADRVNLGGKPIQKSKKQNLEKRGKLLKYHNESETNQALLDRARGEEWNRYMKYNAVTPIPAEEAQRLIDLGAEQSLQQRHPRYFQ